jgi:hypothetical protein
MRAGYSCGAHRQQQLQEDPALLIPLDFLLLLPFPSLPISPRREKERELTLNHHHISIHPGMLINEEPPFYQGQYFGEGRKEGGYNTFGGGPVLALPILGISLFPCACPLLFFMASCCFSSSIFIHPPLGIPHHSTTNNASIPNIPLPNLLLPL